MHAPISDGTAKSNRACPFTVYAANYAASVVIATVAMGCFPTLILPAGMWTF